MEKETYKTAVELLQRYEPTHPSLQHRSTPNQPAHNQPTPSARAAGGRRRVVQPTPHPSMLHQQTSPLIPSTPSISLPPVASRHDGGVPIATPSIPRPHAQAQPIATPARPVEPSLPTSNDTNQQFIPPGESVRFS